MNLQQLFQSHRFHLFLSCIGTVFIYLFGGLILGWRTTIASTDDTDTCGYDFDLAQKFLSAIAAGVGSANLHSGEMVEDYLTIYTNSIFVAFLVKSAWRQRWEASGAVFVISVGSMLTLVSTCIPYPFSMINSNPVSITSWDTSPHVCTSCTLVFMASLLVIEEVARLSAIVTLSLHICIYIFYVLATERATIAGVLMSISVLVASYHIVERAAHASSMIEDGKWPSPATTGAHQPVHMEDNPHPSPHDTNTGQPQQMTIVDEVDLLELDNHEDPSNPN